VALRWTEMLTDLRPLQYSADFRRLWLGATVAQLGQQTQPQPAPVPGNTGIVPPGAVTPGNTGIVPPGAVTPGNTGIVPPGV